MMLKQYILLTILCKFVQNRITYIVQILYLSKIAVLVKLQRFQKHNQAKRLITFQELNILKQNEFRCNKNIYKTDHNTIDENLKLFQKFFHRLQNQKQNGQDFMNKSINDQQKKINLQQQLQDYDDKINQNTFSFKQKEINSTKLMNLSELKLQNIISQNNPDKNITEKESIYICNFDYNFFQQGADWDCKCKEGQQQSPISIQTNNFFQIKKGAKFNFPNVLQSELIILLEENKLKIKSKNKQNKLFKFAQLINEENEEYYSEEIWFKIKGEHQIDNKEFDMEIQIPFIPLNKELKQISILSLLFSEIPMGSNFFISKINFFNLPNKDLNQTDFIRNEDNLRKISLEDIFKTNSNDQFYDLFDYYSYEGSNTDPQCEENVKWYIVSQPKEIGYAQFKVLQQSIYSITSQVYDDELKIEYGNNRQLQNINGRIIKKFSVNGILDKLKNGKTGYITNFDYFKNQNMIEFENVI